MHDEHALTVAQETPPGRYQLRVGLYDGKGRVAGYDAAGERLPDDALELGSVEIR